MSSNELILIFFFIILMNSSIWQQNNCEHILSGIYVTPPYNKKMCSLVLFSHYSSSAVVMNFRVFKTLIRVTTCH